jgi:hypothetical protein
MSTAYIKIKNGSYRNMDVSGKTFQLVKQFQPGTNGGFVTVENGNQFPGCPEKLRIKLSSVADYEFTTDSDTAVQQLVTQAEADPNANVGDAERIEQIAQRFQILEDMTKAATQNEITAMIVSGPPGVGKSYGVEKEIEKATLFDQIAGRRLRAEVVKGAATPIGLYQTLYKYSDKNCLVVFDDCDSILLDDVSLNLLKGALDSGKKRKISWLAESRVLRSEGIPDSFYFKGSVIFITNLKFDKVRSQKLRDHLDALQSRCHYLDLTLDSMRDKILRIKQIAKSGALFAEMDIEQCGQDDIIEFMDTNKSRLREMSLRMAIKIAQLYKSFPGNWKAMTESTCMKSA